MAVIYLAGGCFWGIQGYFDKLKGTMYSQVGYANSNIDNPTYEIVCSGRSGAAEALELAYDEKILHLEEIIGRFLSIIDPCALNYQGNDIGTQYRSGVFFVDSKDEKIIRECFMLWESKHRLKIVTELAMLKNFYKAESYHQNYLQKNPYGYCHIDIQEALKPYKA